MHQGPLKVHVFTTKGTLARSVCSFLGTKTSLFIFFTGQQPKKITMLDLKFKMAAKIHIFTSINQKDIQDLFRHFKTLFCHMNVRKR